jgi:CRP-like cAMP-binding protein
MGAIPNSLRGLAFFSGLSPEEFGTVSAAMETVEMAPAAIVFNEGDAGDRAYVVAAGAVEVFTRICGDVEKTLLTLRPGGVFGELSLFTGEARSATAKVIEPATLLSLAAPAFEGLVARHPAVAGKLMRSLLVTLAGRLRHTTELYRQAVAWGLDVGAVTELNFHQLITEQVHLSVELLNGNTVNGVLLKVEKGAVGHELLVKTQESQFTIIPYAAVARVAFARQSIGPRDS